MKKTLAILAVGLFAAGSIGCSSTPKQEEAPAETTVSAEETPMAEETQPEDQATAPAATTEDLSLGASSSGRGH